ncbi:MAG: sulfite exporter TauE/SafE family protein [Paludibacteraceae bacterium]|nr:sulfite exporter TauE/SafE family protein [Paludibacteraceae bacterium]
MDFISHLYNGGNLWISSIIWGIIVAVCPCTMAANITAITAMSRDKREKRDVFARGIAYAFGRAAAYIALGILLVTFAQGLRIGESFQHLFGLFLGPILVLIGILMLDIIHIHGLADKCMVVFNRMVKQFGFWKSFLLGIMLAFAFCPYSATIYFGVVIPSSLSAENGYIVPIFFAIGATIPVLSLAWIFAYSMDTAKKKLDKFQQYELWFRRILAILFIISGILFILEYYFEL